MGIAKPDGNAASIEAARQARRELHEEIQAAREALRELRAELAGYGALAAAAGARAQAALDDCERRVQAEIDELSRHITAENAKVLEAIARYLGAESPEHLLTQITNSLSEAVTPVLSEQLANDMPDVIQACLEDMKTDGEKLNARARARVRGALQDMPNWQAVPFYTDNGAAGAVPGPRGH